MASPDAGVLGSHAPVSEAVVVGRDAGVALQVDDRWCTGQHIEVKPGGEPDVWSLRDLGSSNGTLVDGHSVEVCRLLRGAVVRVGATVLLLARGARERETLGLIGWSAALAATRAGIKSCARGDRPIHITGESGVGKELVARAIHQCSGRSGDLVAFNGATLTEGVADSQLFGHRRGAFTGAAAPGEGLFGAADEGTLFLDEIAAVPLAVQAKLLRAVDTGEIQPVGEPRSRHVDVRLLTATLRDLQERAEQGLFREDLYHRLAHTRLSVPPLRERRLDVVPLVDHLLGLDGELPLSRAAAASNAAAWAVADLVECLLTYDWPGNVRALQREIPGIAEWMRECAADVGAPPDPLGFLSADVRDHTASAPDGAAGPGLDVAELRAMLEDKDVSALVEAIRSIGGGAIKRFAQTVGPALGRSTESVRRQLYDILDAEARARARE